MKKKLSYSDIAYSILKAEKEEHFLHYKEITQRAFKQGLIKESDIIVAGNVSSAINSEIRQAKLNGEESRFISYGNGKYGLSEKEPRGIFKEIRDKNNAVKRTLLKSLLNMSPFAFEELIGEVLRHLGFENIIVTRKTGDGGIDVMGELVVAGTIKNNICVQVKRWNNNVQRGNISELRGSLRPHQTGLFITTSDFSKPAIHEANDPYKAPISLINGMELVEMLCTFGIGVTSENVTLYALDENTGISDISQKDDVSEEDGLEIFTTYKGQKFYAVYFSPTKIIYDNEVFNSPSAAGTKVQNGLPVNGWKFWKFIDKKDGKTYPLDRLRK